MNRKEYMEQSGSSFEVHRTYYAQMVTPAVLRIVRESSVMDRVRASADINLNSIPLWRWDIVASFVRAHVEPKLRELGDCWSLAGGVCIVKEAARQLKEEN